MGLFKRIADIVNANLNDLVDKCEDPEKILKQAIREMEDSIRAATTDAAKVVANEKKAEKELARNREEATKYSARALKAVEAGDDNEARRALGKQNEYEKIAEAVESQLETAKGSTSLLKQQIAGMNAKLEEAKRNLSTLSARQKAAEIRKKAVATNASAGAVVADNSAFEKFERMREKVENAEAEADALAELSGAAVSDSGLDGDIEDQLAALKKKAKK